MLANEEIYVGDVDLRDVLTQIAQDRTTPPLAHREAVEWLEDPFIETWLRIPGEPPPEF